MSLDPRVADIIAISGAALALIGLIVAGLAHRRFAKLRSSVDLLRGPGGGDDFVTAAERQIAEIDKLRVEVGGLRQQLGAAEARLAEAVRHVAVVRYDAFAEMGGRMSFSAALLDDAGDGVVISSIAARADTRTYAKGVRGGRSDQALSPEEQQAVDYALRGQTRGAS